MSKQQKNLSLNTLKKQNAKTYKDKKQIHFANGDKLDIDVVFQPIKIEKVAQEVLSVLTDATTREKGEKLDAGAWFVITIASIIKNFTSIETDAEGLDGLTELNDELKNAEYLDQIIGAFDQEELEKAFGKINEALQRVNQQVDLMVKSNEASKSEEEVVEESGE